MGAQICSDGRRYDPCVCAGATLAWFRAQMAGQWVGTRTSPWETEATGVTLEFKTDGTWSGTCVGEDCSIFYYGSSVETAKNRYTLTFVNDDQIAFGRITLTWSFDDSTEGDLRRIRFGADQKELFFEFWNTWSGEYGPVAFSLHRAP
jgi:hypothetical protein